MTETVQFSKIGKQDIQIGFGTFEVTLADGRVVTLDEVDIGYLVGDAFTEANLPVSVAGVGRLGRVTDNARGLWMHGRASKWFSLLGEVVYAEDFDTFADAITDIGTTERTLLINKSMEVTGAVTVNAATTLWFVNQGALNINSGVTVTHNGLTKAPRRQIIEGTGLIAFGGGAGSIRVYPEWWGAVVDNSTDDTSKVQSAITALSTTIGGMVEISPYTKLTAGDLTIGARLLVEDYADPSAPVWRTTSATRKMMESAAGLGGLSNIGLAASVSSNALTIALKDASGDDPTTASPVTIPFRIDPITTGRYNDRTATAATSLVLSAGSTLGFGVSETSRIYIYAIDVGGTIELAVSKQGYLDEAALHSTTAEGGAGGADSASTLYSTTSRTTEPLRLIGWLEIATDSTPGNWANAPTTVQPLGYGAAQPFNNESVAFGGDVVAGAAFTLNNLTDRTAVTSVGTQLHVPAQTQGFINASGTIAIGAAHYFGIPTWTNDNATLTITDSANVYIAGIPVAGSNVTLTNASVALMLGGNLVSDTDSTDDLGTSTVRWANGYFDKLSCGTGAGTAAIVNILGTAQLQLNLESTSATSTGAEINAYHNSSTPADNDVALYFYGFANDSGATKRNICYWRMKFDDVTSTTMDSSFQFATQDNQNAAGAGTVANLTSVGVWTDASAEKDKEYEGDVWGDGGAILEKIKGLKTGRYHSARAKTPEKQAKERHCGPSAEAMYDTFGLGRDPRDPNNTPGLAAKDVASVALAGVQALLTRIEAMENKRK